jgi:hypothetical protein
MLKRKTQIFKILVSNLNPWLICVNPINCKNLKNCFKFKSWTEKNLQSKCLSNMRNLVICGNKLINEPSVSFEKCMDENFDKKFYKDEVELRMKLLECQKE